jgi:hypothetical protein
MNVTRIKCVSVLCGLAIIGFGPLSLTCLIGLFVVLARPRWFYEVVWHLYRDKPGGSVRQTAGRETGDPRAATVRIKCFLSLLGLLVLDIAPVPVTSTIGLYVALWRPFWFKTMVENMYRGVAGIKRRNASPSE